MMMMTTTTMMMMIGQKQLEIKFGLLVDQSRYGRAKQKCAGTP